MGAIANPILEQMYPQYGGGAVPSSNSGSTGSAQNPLLSTTATAPNSSAPGSSNPYAAGFSANSSPYSSTGGTALPTTLTSPSTVPAGTTGSGLSSLFGIGGTTPQGIKELYNTLSKTYGPGVGDLISNFLTSGAGYNQQAINNMLASLQPGIERGEEDLMSQFSASGNRFGSGAQIGMGDFLSQVNLNEGQLVTGMYEQSLTNFINVLMGAGSAADNYQQSKPTTWDIISGILGIGNAAGGAIQNSGAGGGIGKLGDILSGL